MKHPPYCQTRFPLALILNGVTVTPNLFWSTTQETNEGLHLYGAAVSIIEILSLWDEYKKKLLSERGMGFNNCQWCHYFSKSAENTHKIFFFFFAKNHLHLHCEVFQGHSEHSMAQDGTVWIICTWNMQTSTLPSCTVKWWVSEHVLSHLIASAFKRRQHLICATVRRALISRQTSTVFLESHQVCFVQMYQQRFIRVHKWTLVCLLVSLFVSPCTSFFFSVIVCINTYHNYKINQFSPSN